MKDIYIIAILNGIFASFITMTKGALFTENIKGVLNIVSIVINVVICGIAAFKFGFINILWTFLSYLITAWISAFIFSKTIFKRY